MTNDRGRTIIKLRAILVQQLDGSIWVFHAEDECSSFEDPTAYEAALVEIAALDEEYKVRTVTLSLSADVATLHRFFEDDEIVAPCAVESSP